MSKDDDANETQENTLHHIRTADSVLLPIPRDAFEKLYLSPKHPSVSGDLRKKLGNPTPIALMGFLIASIPNACIMMGWRGAGGQGGAIIPDYIFFGGIVQLLGAIGEWITGNTFSCALFFTYGTFWIVQGTSLMPFFATGVHYSPTGDPLEGLETPAYFASSGFYYLAMGIITFVYTVCSIRTNACLLSALILLVITYGCFAGVFFQHALGATALAERLQIIGGAFNFALCFPILWIFFAQLLEAVDFPITVPVGDLSTVVIGRSQRLRKQQSDDE